MPVEQADILADEHAGLLGEQLATKHDIALLRADMVAMELWIKDQRTIRLGGIMAGAIAITATLVRRRPWSGYSKRKGRRVSTWR
jgi:hypothetical protein